MNSRVDKDRCTRADDVGSYALGVLPAAEARELQVHLASCEYCREELNGFGPVVDSLHAWPTAILRPTTFNWDHLLSRIATGPDAKALDSSETKWIEPEWEAVAPGISCKLLSTDSQRNVVTMLVTLAPGTDYPPHTHAGTEELHLLDGELWINENKLYPGDYNRAHAGTSDQRVWSETGCTCLLITSPADVLA